MNTDTNQPIEDDIEQIVEALAGKKTGPMLRVVAFVNRKLAEERAGIRPRRRAATSAERQRKFRERQKALKSGATE